MIAPFRLERYFAQYEFSARYLLSASDTESLSLAELLAMASPKTRSLWDNLRLGYTESPGHPNLRGEISQLYSHAPAENLLVAAPEEAIFVAMHTLLVPGDHVVVLAPAYQSLHEIARSLGCEVSDWPVQRAGAGWQVDLPGLERLLTSRTRLLVVNFPHNPTGCLPSLAELEEIVALARRRGVTIFSDEMYRLLEWNPSVRLPAMCDLYEHGISLSGLSKSFSLPGLRIGWLATQDPTWLNRWLTFKDYTTICNSAPSEILAIIALQNRDAILRRALEIVQANLATADAFFAAYSQWFDWPAPRAGSVAFPAWLGSDSAEAFCRRMIAAQGVMITPGGLFGGAPERFRIGLGRKNFSEALARVAQELDT